MIAVQGVSKSFPGVTALDDVTFTIQAGHVHGLVGENGAGKSTLIKILSGIHTDYSGTISFNGKPMRFTSVHDAQKQGVATIFQELTIVPELSVAENIFLGREPVKFGGIIDWQKMRERSIEALAFLDVPLSPKTIVGTLSIANQQIVEISKSLVLNSKIIIMDEPTSSLTEHEVNQLFLLIRRLQENGITILYVSHKLEEIFKICDTISVFRDGKHVGTKKKTETNRDGIIKMMVGRSLQMLYPERTGKKQNLLLSVKGLTRKGEFEDITFDLYEGEIIGFAGLIGAGRTEMAKTLFGTAPYDSGEIVLQGSRKLKFRHPSEALARGVAYLSEDRKGEGLMLQLTIKENMSVSILKRIAPRFFVKNKVEQKLVLSYAEQFKVKMVSTDQIVESLSGGNQQKVIITRLLMTESRVFIFDEPTRGIDVGAKYEIYKIMNDLTLKGKGIIFISSELPEVLGISDRIFCMCEGKLVKVFENAEADPEKIMHVLTGGEVA